jgi:hypothetical protein
MEVLSTNAAPRARYFIAEESARDDPACPAIYLDTTVVSYLTTARLSRQLSIARRQRITRVWWGRYRHRHALWISNVVLNEAAAGDVFESKARLGAIVEIDALKFDSPYRCLAEKLVCGGLLPEKAHTDARHISIAATNSIPLLLTWNCKHLANPFIHRRIVQACETEGFRCPEICTPEHLMRTYTHARSIHC